MTMPRGQVWTCHGGMRTRRLTRRFPAALPRRPTCPQDQPLPPVLCFAMGSLGFLTPFDAAHFAPTLERVLDTASQPLFCTLRTRKRCEVVHEGQLVEVHHVLNE